MLTVLAAKSIRVTESATVNIKLTAFA